MVTREMKIRILLHICLAIVPIAVRGGSTSEEERNGLPSKDGNGGLQTAARSRILQEFVCTASVEAEGEQVAAVVPGGQHFLTAARDGLRIRRLEDGFLVRKLAVPLDTVSPPEVAFDAEGNLAIVSVEGGSISVWDLRVGTEKLRLRDPDDREFVFGFSPGGGYVTCGRWNGEIAVHDLKVGSVAFTLSTGIRGIHEVAFSPSGRTLGAGGERCVCIWDWRRRKQLHKYAVGAPGRFLASGTRWMYVMADKSVLDLDAGKVVSKLDVIGDSWFAQRPISPSPGHILVAAFAESPESPGSLLLLGIRDGNVICRSTLLQGTCCVALSSDGRYMLTMDCERNKFTFPHLPLSVAPGLCPMTWPVRVWRLRYMKHSEEGPPN